MADHRGPKSPGQRTYHYLELQGERLQTRGLETVPQQSQKLRMGRNILERGLYPRISSAVGLGVAATAAAKAEGGARSTEDHSVMRTWLHFYLIKS